MDCKGKNGFVAIDERARFLETARILGCDEDKAVFDKKLKAVAKPLPMKNSNPSGGGTNEGENGR